MIKVPVEVVRIGGYKSAILNAPEIVDELSEGGVSMPDIVQVIFNTSLSKTVAKRDENGNLVIDSTTNKPIRENVKVAPKLATTIYFGDGSKVTVTNSANDPILDDKGEIMPEAYERGVIYAIVKRLFSRYDKDENGNVILKSEGFGRILHTLVEKAYNQPKAAAQRKDAKDASRAEHARRQEEAQARGKKARPSLAKTVQDLADTVASLRQIVDERLTK